MTAVRLEAFAKVNLSLVVLGRRTDGFHELDTVFQTVDLADTLSFEPAPELALTIDADLPVDDGNLVIRAARALAAEAGIVPGAAIRLEKRIPWGAGLGGGSADAAATLLGLTALWGVSVPGRRLLSIAAALGSDVPFFLYGGCARGTGRGERIEPMPDPPGVAIVLLVPPFGLATPDVYRRLRAPALTAGEGPTNLLGSGPGPAPDRNDLEPAAESVRPEVRAIRESLRSAGAVRARLSGSGSAVFGIFDDAGSAQEALSRLGGLPDGTRALVVSPVGREAFGARAVPAAIRDGWKGNWGVDKW